MTTGQREENSAVTPATAQTFSQLFMGTAYIDPTDFNGGDEKPGYLALPVLLSVFRKVVVFSPYPNYYEEAIDAASHNESMRWWGCRWRGLERFAQGTDPALSVVAREGYKQKDDVRKGCSDKFLGVVKELENRSFEANAQDVYEALADADVRKRMSESFCAQQDNIPERYSKRRLAVASFAKLSEPVPRDRIRVPPQFKEIWNDDRTSYKEKVLLLAQYDYRNDCMAQSQHDVNREFPSIATLFTYQRLGRQTPAGPLQALYDECPGENVLDVLVGIVREIVPIFCEHAMNRLNKATDERGSRAIGADEIERFREEEREAFWANTDTMLKAVMRERPTKRLEVAREWARDCEAKIRFPGQAAFLVAWTLAA